MQNSKQAIFSLGEEEYGFDIMDVGIIEKSIPVETVAGLPKNLRGIIRLRGDVIPVYSLRRKFGLADKAADEETRFIITAANGIQVAYEVDEMKEIVQPGEGQTFEIPSVVKSRETSYLKSITSLGERLVVVLDRNGLLTGEEQDKLKEALKK